MKYVFLHILLPWRKSVAAFFSNSNKLMQLKTTLFLFILTNNHTKICEIILNEIKNSVHNTCIKENIM